MWNVVERCGTLWNICDTQLSYQERKKEGENEKI